jgi:hypothetical protein
MVSCLNYGFVFFNLRFRDYKFLQVIENMESKHF